LIGHAPRRFLERHGLGESVRRSIDFWGNEDDAISLGVRRGERSRRLLQRRMLQVVRPIDDGRSRANRGGGSGVSVHAGGRRPYVARAAGDDAAKPRHDYAERHERETGWRIHEPLIAN
jgi:hypothetical protein